jgi:membrane protein
MTNALRSGGSLSRIFRARWWRVLSGTVRRFSRHHVLDEAGGIAFFMLLGLGPAVTALVLLYGLFIDPDTATQDLLRLAPVMPEDAAQLIADQLVRLGAQDREALGLGAAAGFAVALWSANRAMRALLRALNQVREAQESRGWLARRLVALAFTLGGLLLTVLAIAAVIALPLALGVLGLGGAEGLALRLLRWPLLVAVVALFLAVLYRYGPCETEPHWRWVSWGSAVATLIWLAGSAAYSWYVGRFGGRSGGYGPLGAVVGAMTWFWLSAAVALLGAVVNAELERANEGIEPPASTR